MKPNKIQIVLDDDEGNGISPDMRFVEIENDLGKSIFIGRQYRRTDGYWIIEISNEDFEPKEEPNPCLNQG